MGGKDVRLPFDKRSLLEKNHQHLGERAAKKETALTVSALLSPTLLYKAPSLADFSLSLSLIILLLSHTDEVNLVESARVCALGPPSSPRRRRLLRESANQRSRVEVGNVSASAGAILSASHFALYT